jgi:agmatinase
VLQLDAHADLRDEYENSRHSHACAMARARELTPYVAQLGVRSMSSVEAKLIRDNNFLVYTMHEYRSGKSSLGELLAFLPNPLYLTLDVDVLDWSVVSSTGTPEPGGFTWDEIIGIVSEILDRSHVVGIDVVELAATEGDNRSAFAVAKLIYKMIGYQFRSDK